MYRCQRSFAVLTLLASFAAPLVAHGQTATPPGRTSDAPPPPAMTPVDDVAEPQVTIRKREGATIEEYRVSGRLEKVVVTPENGVPYTLVNRGDGTLVPLDTPGTPQLSVPMWVIGTF
jgi:hypothetical protein